MRASAKEVQELSADAKKAVGSAGGPLYGASSGRRTRSSRRASRVGSAARVDRSLFSPASFGRLQMSLEDSSGIGRGG